MKIIVHYSGEPFTRMFNALRRSVEQNCPHAEIVGVCADRARARSVERAYAENTTKLGTWRHAVHKYDDEPLVLMDADTLVLGDLSEAFNEQFDIGLTVRDYKLRYNAGVVYVQPTDNARSFIDAWFIENQYMHDNLRRVRNRIALNGGINQASLDSIISGQSNPSYTDTLLIHKEGTTPDEFDRDHPDRGSQWVIRELPCSIWNSVDQTWSTFSDVTKVLHVKGQLRALSLTPARKYDELAHLWRTYDQMEKLCPV